MEAATMNWRGLPTLRVRQVLGIGYLELTGAVLISKGSISFPTLICFSRVMPTI